MQALAATPVRPSPLLLRLLGVWYSLALVVCMHIPIALPLRGALLLLILLDFFWTRRRLARCYGISGLRITAAHEVQVLRDRQWVAVQPVAPCYRLPGLIILRVREGRRVRSWLFVPGMFEAQAWRRLSVWVRWRLPELLPQRVSLWRRLWRRRDAA